MCLLADYNVRFILEYINIININYCNGKRMLELIAVNTSTTFNAEVVYINITVEKAFFNVTLNTYRPIDRHNMAAELKPLIRSFVKSYENSTKQNA